jgi:hypothetical protein
MRMILVVASFFTTEMGMKALVKTSPPPHRARGSPPEGPLPLWIKEGRLRGIIAHRV